VIRSADEGEYAHQHALLKARGEQASLGKNESVVAAVGGFRILSTA
jgi:hypothetical protein